MTKAALEASLNSLDIWLIIFGVVVVIGVAGESVTGFLHWRRSGELQSVQTAENLKLQLQIETLRRSVGPRDFDASKLIRFFKDVPKPEQVRIKYSRAAGDGWYVALKIEQLLHQVGWPVLAGSDVLSADDPIFDGGVALSLSGDPTSGIKIMKSFAGGSPETPASHALTNAIAFALGGAMGSADRRVPPGHLWVVIFPRP